MPALNQCLCQPFLPEEDEALLQKLFENECELLALLGALADAVAAEDAAPSLRRVDDGEPLLELEEGLLGDLGVEAQYALDLVLLRIVLPRLPILLRPPRLLLRLDRLPEQPDRARWSCVLEDPLKILPRRPAFRRLRRLRRLPRATSSPPTCQRALRLPAPLEPLLLLRELHPFLLRPEHREADLRVQGLPLEGFLEDPAVEPQILRDQLFPREVGSLRVPPDEEVHRLRVRWEGRDPVDPVDPGPAQLLLFKTPLFSMFHFSSVFCFPRTLR